MNSGGCKLIPVDGLATDEFLLRPIRRTDAQWDYEAVMETKDFLRDWEGTGWPEDGFTVEGNEEDLVRLEQRHQSSESFTYTVVSRAAARCLGCVYIFPTSAQLFTKAQVIPRGDVAWSAFQAAVYFWVRKSAMAEGLDHRLLQALNTWLHREWSLDRYLLITNERVYHQMALLESTGRKALFELRYPSKPSAELAFS
jgi:hypothetical protein